MITIEQEAEVILLERFGRDSVITLGTCCENAPDVRYVNAFYQDGAFSVLTNALSGKVQHISQNPTVAIAGDWFTGHGTAVNLGRFGKEENRPVSEKMKTVFGAWIHNGHGNLEDVNTSILRIDLSGGTLFSQGTRYDL